MQVKRVNINKDEVTKFNFDVLASKYIIKNFTEGDIYVCLGKEFNEEKSVKIPTMIAEVIFDNFNEEITNYTTKLYNCVTVKADDGGEVEVRCLK